MRPYLKNKLKADGTGDIVQVVEYLHSKHEVLSSDLNTTKRKKEMEGRKEGRRKREPYYHPFPSCQIK
jgi:hypothetical protein